MVSIKRIQHMLHSFDVTLTMPDAIATRRLTRDELRSSLMAFKVTGHIKVGNLDVEIKTPAERASVLEHAEGTMREKIR